MNISMSVLVKNTPNRHVNSANTYTPTVALVFTAAPPEGFLDEQQSIRGAL